MSLIEWGMAVALLTQSAEPQQLSSSATSATRICKIVANASCGVDAFAQTPHPAQFQDDPADSLYRTGTQAINRDNFREAIRLFKQIIDQYPKSQYASQAYYWHAFALYRLGGQNDLRDAHEVLRTLRKRFPKEFERDGAALEQRVLGALARRGDSEAQKAVLKRSERLALEKGGQASTSCEMDNAGPKSTDVKVAALNALVQMDAARALPTLQEVLRRRDEGSICLRRMAVLLLGQRRTEGAEAILLHAARSDPDLEVRKRAVLHLSEFNTERSLSALDSIVRTVKDSALLDRAAFALSQSGNSRAQDALRAYAARDDVPTESRRKAITSILTRKSAEDVAFLRKLYGRLEAEDSNLRQQIVQSMSQQPDSVTVRWLLDIARDKSETIELRRKIVRSMSQQPDSVTARWLLNIVRDKSETIELRIMALAGSITKAVSIDSRLKLYAPTLERSLRAQLIDIYGTRISSVWGSRSPPSAPGALDELGEAARRDPDNDLRQAAIGYISRSKDPYAAEVLRTIIKRE